VGRDVTDRAREREQRERALQLKAVVGTVVGASHAINNPLATIATYVELVRRGLGSGRFAPDEQQDLVAHLDTVLLQVQRIHEYTTKLADVARPEFVEYVGRLPMIDVDRSGPADTEGK